jgi:16S rRNA (uracil1498-N3)-methyltransferase
MKIHVRRFYAPPENFRDTSVLLSADETRHLRNVLRLREGDTASVFDGEGREFLCTVEKTSGKNALLALVKEISPSSPESPLDLTIWLFKRLRSLELHACSRF